MRYGLVKSALDAHTLGISHVSQLLEECGMEVVIADSSIAEAVDHILDIRFFGIFKDWILKNRITHLGYSYRLDPRQALDSFRRLIHRIGTDGKLSPGKGGLLRRIFFAGLPEACECVEKEFAGRFPTFRGDETPVETLEKLGVPGNLIPQSIRESSIYDELRLSFGEKLIGEERQFLIPPFEDYTYIHYGTPMDHLIQRLRAARKRRKLPLTRAHVGPYLPDREEALALFSDWLKKLAKSHFLDIVSVGSSQLSQSKFGEDWGDLPNGGGVPFNSAIELRAIREDASPMLVRAYSATNNIPQVARILEENLNMAWHALSLWWFNRIDGRGPLGVKESLSQHLETLKYVANVGKPYEPNLSHHFAFRGADDVTYIASSYLAAKMAKLLGIRHLVLQNMLNNPRATWGVRDLAKARALLKLVRSLEDRRFRVIYQPRAGLDYFSPDIERAKVQLAAVTALMDDVEPENSESPEIIHVVSYSEALFLATPEVVDESVRITKAALEFYPEFRDQNSISDIIRSRELEERTDELWEEATLLVEDMERNIEHLYSSEGLYKVFKRGYFPVPYLWEGRHEFAHAVNWTTKIIDGGVCVVDASGRKMSMNDRLERIRILNG
ncbi:MAG: cobalamin-binding protein [Candidatus Aminicenantales bacterium]